VWGLFNVLLVKGVDMDDVKPIQNACDAAEALKKDVEYNINEGTE